MKRYLLILSAAGLLAACGGNLRKAPVSGAETAEMIPASGTETASGCTISDGHTAETSLDYLGSYSGTLPAADCPGIETTLVLAADGSYTLHMVYLEREAAFDEKGTFRVEGNLLTLVPSDGEQPAYYKVEENRLRHLDGDRQPITGELAEHYVLHKKS